MKHKLYFSLGFLGFYFSLIIMLSVFSIFSFTKTAFADNTSGYAWGENIGWLDFSQMIVESDALSGYAYSPNTGWISLNCANTSSCGTTDYKVTNSEGSLSGYAWGENIGWVDFSQASIDTGSGIFDGYAYSPNIGWISLNCSNTDSCNTTDYKVTTESTVSHASSGSSRRAITPPNTTPPNIPLPTSPIDCNPSFNFSPTTGLPCVKTIPPPICIITETLKQGNKGEQVKCLQNILKISADGIFGPQTKNTVITFQKLHNLTPDSIVGPITRSFINK